MRGIGTEGQQRYSAEKVLASVHPSQKPAEKYQDITDTTQGFLWTQPLRSYYDPTVGFAHTFRPPPKPQISPCRQKTSRTTKDKKGHKSDTTQCEADLVMHRPSLREPWNRLTSWHAESRNWGRFPWASGYFLARGKQKLGPFSLGQLQDMAGGAGGLPPLKGRCWPHHQTVETRASPSPSPAPSTAAGSAADPKQTSTQ